MKEKHRWFAVVKRIPKDRSVIGAEIGVLNGATATKILESCPNVVHIMIDPWSIVNIDESYKNSGAEEVKQEQAWFEENYRVALEDTEPYKDRRRIMRKKSVEAAFEIKDESLDYAFIDGDHSYEGVKRDITLWWPKVKKGGWIGGHDWKSERHPDVTYAVVDSFVEPHETDTDKTWFVWK